MSYKLKRNKNIKSNDINEGKDLIDVETNIIKSSSDKDKIIVDPVNVKDVNTGTNIDTQNTNIPEPQLLDPIIYKLPRNKDKNNNIINQINNYTDENKEYIMMSYSKSIPTPRLDLGFHHYIHSTKDKMSFAEKLTTNKKFYNVVNPFEHIIDKKYNESLAHHVSEYFQIEKDNKPKIMSRGFYKLWELVLLFDLIPTDTNNFISVHLAEGPGSFMQGTILFRDKLISKGFHTNKDRAYGVTLHSENDLVPELETEFINYYNNGGNERIIKHKTYTIARSENSKKKDNGNLTSPKTIVNFGKTLGDDKANFITADGGFVWKNENVQEQEAMYLLLGQICAAVRIQEKGGNFVLKIYESYTVSTVKLISILNDIYSEVYITKTNMSRPSNSEKYIVCKNFKLDNEMAEKMSDSLLDIVEKFKNHSENNYIHDIYNKYIPSNNIINVIRSANIEITNTQIKIINEIVNYKNSNIYYGEAYSQYIDNQLFATKYWNETYLNNKKSIDREKYENIKIRRLNYNTKLEKYINTNVEDISISMNYY